MLDQEIRLIGVRHAVGDGMEREVLRHPDHVGEQLAALAIRRDGLDQESIELQYVDRLTHQQRERGIALAKAVEDDPDADPAELFESLGGLRIVAQEQTLGDLEIEQIRRVARALERVDDGGEDVVLLELDRREVDREAARIPAAGGPVRSLLAGLLERPAPEGPDEARLLGRCRNPRRSLR